MRALLMLLALGSAHADDRGRILGYVDATLDLPAPVRERPKVRVRIEPAPAHPKSSARNYDQPVKRACP